MDGIGESLREARLSSGVSLEEVSRDLGLNVLILENIESGKIGAFKNVLELKTNISDYAKYLGLDSEALVDEFNDYMFEYTSKIPVKEIEKSIEQQQKKEGKEKTISSPYTAERSNSLWIYIAIGVLVFVLVILAIFWCTKQVTTRNVEVSTTVLNYRR